MKKTTEELKEKVRAKEEEIKNQHWNRLKHVYQLSCTLMERIDCYKCLVEKEDIKMILENLRDCL